MTDTHPDKQNGMAIRLTLCERDATDRHMEKRQVYSKSAYALLSIGLVSDVLIQSTV